MIDDSLIKKIVDWIVANRRGPSFNYPHNKIVSLVRESIKQDVFVFSTDNTLTRLNGIACGEKSELEHHIFIHDVLTTEPGIVRKFVEYCMLKYPGYPIYGTVRGRKRLIHNPTKFARRLK